MIFRNKSTFTLIASLLILVNCSVTYAGPIVFNFSTADDNIRNVTDIRGTITFESDLAVTKQYIHSSGTKTVGFNKSGWAELFAKVNGVEKRSAFYVGGAYFNSINEVFWGGATGAIGFHYGHQNFNLSNPFENFNLDNWDKITIQTGGCQEDRNGCSPEESFSAYMPILEINQTSTAPVPEPASILLTAIGFLFLIFMRKLPNNRINSLASLCGLPHVNNQNLISQKERCVLMFEL